MLKHRVLTALILIPLVFWGIFSLSSEGMSYALGVIVLIGSWEWTRMIGINQLAFRALYVAFMATLLFILRDHYLDHDVVQFALYISAAWWLIGLYLIFSYRSEKGFAKQQLPFNMLVGFVLLIPTWLALLNLHNRIDGSHWLLFVLALMWVADSGAYFVGRKFGKNKLAPYVSPGKSREGVMGAVLAAIVYAILSATFWLNIDSAKLMEFVGLCVIIVLVSVEGDLVESLFKRRIGIKDSGNILPGHGGVLDRIDSVMAAAPMFVLGAMLLEI